MSKVIAFCAALTFAACGTALPAHARAKFANPFDSSILRPPASIPHTRGTTAAAAPLPRPKPVSARQIAPVAAPSAGPVFPPVTPLE